MDVIILVKKYIMRDTPMLEGVARGLSYFPWVRAYLWW